MGKALRYVAPARPLQLRQLGASHHLLHRPKGCMRQHADELWHIMRQAWPTRSSSPPPMVHFAQTAAPAPLAVTRLSAVYRNRLFFGFSAVSQPTACLHHVFSKRRVGTLMCGGGRRWGVVVVVVVAVAVVVVDVLHACWKGCFLGRRSL